MGDGDEEIVDLLEIDVGHVEGIIVAVEVLKD
jgi:hypothetical protein